jgi:hypothetical protein
MKQTAVQWLVEQLENHNGVTRPAFENVIQQAKAMEKEQIKEAWLNSLTKGDYNSAEQYYTETYESNT